MLSTQSRGNMTINSADALDPPTISPNWLLDPGDAEQAVVILQRIREIANASGIVESEYQPGANVTSNEDILDWLRNNMDLIYHASSTCKFSHNKPFPLTLPSNTDFSSPGAMGMANDTQAVVDSHARVHGVSNLRVVDASAFPILPPGQPQATVYMFAEKIAHMILSGD